MSEIMSVEFSDEGHIVIETVEDGYDCFYAIDTKDGDFKGIWLSPNELRLEKIGHAL
jgi:hypothetical protein